MTHQSPQSSFAQFNQQGFYRGRQLLAIDEIEALQHRLNAHLSRLAKAYLTPFSNSVEGLSLTQRLQAIAAENPAYARSLLQAMLSDSHLDPMIANVIEHDNLQQTLHDLLPGFSHFQYTTRLRVCASWATQFSSGWHQDVADESHSGDNLNRVQLACWLPLADVAENTGALACIAEKLAHSIMHLGDDGRYHMDADYIAQAQPQVLSCKAGDALFLDRFLPHRSLPIRADTCRITVATWVKAEKIN